MSEGKIKSLDIAVPLFNEEESVENLYVKFYQY